MSKYLYLEGASGISGDMTVAALLDLGASRDKLDSALSSLGIEGFHYHIGRRASYSIEGCDFSVHLHHHEHHHDEAYDAHEHTHHHGHSHHHEHRHLAEVYAIIDRAELSDSARALAKKIFLIVAQAEAKAHGAPLEKVHFHEVGAIDSIVDIIATAALVDDLDIDGCIVTGLSEGHGTITCQHGELPVPVPAVLNIAEAHGIPLRPNVTTHGEMVTPTGIAIAAALRTQDELPPAFRILRSGIGLGKRDFGRANFLRVLLLTPQADPERIYTVEANIDDSTPEELGLLKDKLLREAGARDVWFVPCLMKKNRPAVQLGVLCTEEKLPLVEDAVLRHSSTIGLRKYPVQRTIMERETISVQLPEGAVDVKKAVWKDIVRYQPEYDSVRKLAEETGKPFRVLFDRARRQAEQS